MKKRTKVLVLLATYNGELWVTDQINSILTQKDVDVTLVVSDDRSTDDTVPTIVRNFGHLPNVVLRTWEEGSGSAGANFRRLFRSTQDASFDYVALADQDDIWNEKKLASAVAQLQENDADGYSCTSTAFWESGKEERLTQNPLVRKMDFLFEGAGQGCTFVLTADLFRRVQAFCLTHRDLSEQFHYHDWLIYLLARSWGKKWYFDVNSWIRYRQHGSNEIGSKGSIGAVAKRLQLIKNGWYRRQIDAAVEIYLSQTPDVRIRGFMNIFRAKDSVSRRARLAVTSLRDGRRRLADRTILAVSALAGWI